ncbi:probable F-actin-capping protein subunit beta isoform X2 [Magnolia sinica]|uniref:probable F-actin-capping protein subunit beta isoform X2 n=1 Tax=Magnolia sinica TaxID=86752 RepID=UPI00265B1B36|nr:probable F-actin-capping protein subunit beta isoform X2 [Magnolia sinica]XP_058073262.1 probable F-actin-capping protein subunit beta isoform X2 [Magnolia sinica]
MRLFFFFWANAQTDRLYNRDIYSYRYYEGRISSVYMWEDNEDFVACFLIKKHGSKSGHRQRSYLQKGAWDAIHVIEVGPEEEGTTQYCLIIVMLSLTTDDKSLRFLIIWLCFVQGLRYSHDLFNYKFWVDTQVLRNCINVVEVTQNQNFFKL